MGDTHRVFFCFETPMNLFFISWAPVPSCAHFFFLKRPLLKKKHGQVANPFSFIFPLNRKILCPSGFCHNFFGTESKILVRRPLFFFLFYRPLTSKKSWAVCPSCAKEFFFPPMILISLFVVLCWIFCTEQFVVLIGPLVDLFKGAVLNLEVFSITLYKIWARFR